MVQFTDEVTSAYHGLRRHWPYAFLEIGLERPSHLRDFSLRCSIRPADSSMVSKESKPFWAMPPGTTTAWPRDYPCVVLPKSLLALVPTAPHAGAQTVLRIELRDSPGAGASDHVYDVLEIRLDATQSGQRFGAPARLSRAFLRPILQIAGDRAYRAAVSAVLAMYERQRDACMTVHRYIQKNPHVASRYTGLPFGDEAHRTRWNGKLRKAYDHAVALAR